MDHYQPPSTPSTAYPHISGPRLLRPRAGERIPGPAPQYPPAAHAPIIPVQQFRHDAHPESSEPYAPSIEPSGVSVLSPGSPYEAPHSADRTGFMGRLLSGLNRIPTGMAKHHSRESLYAEYLAHSQAVSARNSAMSPMSRHDNRPLSNLDESLEPDSEPIEFPQPAISSDTDDGTTAVHHDFIRPFGLYDSPYYSNSQLDSRQSKAESSLAPLPPEDTWEYYGARIALFFHWLRKLPWYSPRIVNDYVPARDGRGQYGESKPAVAWYKPRNRHGLDGEKGAIHPPGVFVVPATPQSSGQYTGTFGIAPLPPPPQPMSSFYSDAATAVRPLRTPMTVTSAGIAYPSPGMSSHGLGRHELTYSWYSSTPPEWPHPQAYLSEISSPQTRMGDGY